MCGFMQQFPWSQVVLAHDGTAQASKFASCAGLD